MDTALEPETMNQKTVKLLKKYSVYSGKTDKELKRWWIALPWNRRAGERKRLMQEMGMEAEAGKG